jgi:hypothetical protein
MNSGADCRRRRDRLAWRAVMLKAGALICAAFLAACDFPPEEVERMQQQLQAEISRGQVYIIHSQETLSYMIRNSDVSRGSEEERQRVVRAVEAAALEFLAKYRNYGEVRIYFLGEGTAGIDRPYICRATDGACSLSPPQPAAQARPWRQAPAFRPTLLAAIA